MFGIGYIIIIMITFVTIVIAIVVIVIIILTILQADIVINCRLPSRSFSPLEAAVVATSALLPITGPPSYIIIVIISLAQPYRSH